MIFKARQFSLLLYSALGASMAVSAGPAYAAGQAQFQFGIPSQDLSKALLQFSRQTGLQIAAPGALLKGQRSRAVSGKFSAQDALNHMLQGSGIEARIVGETVIVSAAPAKRSSDASRATTHVAPVNAPKKVDSGVFEVAEDLIVTGTRERSRTSVESMSPVDVLSNAALNSSVSDDLNDTLAQLLPSFNVQRLPANDGAAFVRPATLRGLPGSYTLVLVNGKRYHASAVTQATDLSSLPSSAIKRMEVLRDGASAQYGSEAIAGVLNIILEDKPGLRGFSQFSRYYAGDGNEYRAGLSSGFALGDRGSITLSGEYNHSDVTSRSVQRPDAIVFQENHPDVTVANPVQRWGQPREDRWRGSINSRYDLSEKAELYAFGTFQFGEGLTDFNWRNPDSTSNVFKSTTVFNDFTFRDVYPGGFTPRFGTKYNDQQAVGGMRGDLNDHLSYDVSVDYGHNSTEYNIDETVNASLGPDSPTSFYIGRIAREEFTINGDVVYRLPVGGAEPLNVAAGVERRVVAYKIVAGEQASWEIGDGAAEGLAAGSNGFPGYDPANAGTWSQESYGGYVDLEWKPLSILTTGAAGRYEHYQSFGSRFDYKLSGRLEPLRGIALRATYSTGFRAPDPQQLYSSSVAQSLNTSAGTISTRGRLRVDDPVAIALGAEPLKPERSRNLTTGLVLDSGFGLIASADFYLINMRNRITTSSSFSVPDWYDNPKGYTSINYYINAYKTRTSGYDIVLAYSRAIGSGKFNISLSYNYNRTKMEDDGGVDLSESSLGKFEYKLPGKNGTGSIGYEFGRFSFLAKGRYYGPWIDSSGVDDELFQHFGSIMLFDLAATMKVNEHFTLRAGAENIFDTYPDKATYQVNRGLIYSRNAPYDTDGGQYYIRMNFEF